MTTTVEKARALARAHAIQKAGTTEKVIAADQLKERIYKPVAGYLERVAVNIAGVAAGHDGPTTPEIEERLGHVLAAPGKRVRPAITLLVARLWGAEMDERVINMATAVELLHIATLVHDDTVDHADTRRGRATASSLWGGNAAVLLGDYVFASSAIFVCDTGSIRLIRRFAETIAELARGELNESIDMWRTDITREKYFTRIYDKTASLFSTAAESGAVLAGAPEYEVASLRDFGYNLGMAYQVFDDVLDFESTSHELGKPAGNDLPGGVLTLPVLLALEGVSGNGFTNEGDGARRATSARQATLRYLTAAPATRPALLAGTVEAIKSSDALAHARSIAQEYSNKARIALAGLPETEERECLLSLVDLLLERRA